MPSSYSTNLLLELMADGEKEGLWGEITNSNLEILGRAVSGVTTVALSGTDHTLTMSQGTLSEGHYSLLVLQGAPTDTNTITIDPDTVSRIYLVKNDSGQDAVFTQGSGNNATVADGDIGILFSDGGGASANVTDLTSGLMRNSENLSGLANAATALQNLGITATANELNALDGATLDISAVTATADDLNALGGGGDLVIHGVTVGRGSGSIVTNTAVGNDALSSSGSLSDDNTAVGYNALKSNTSGDNNIAVGSEALRNNTSGDGNVAAGYEALQSNTTGRDNTAVGDRALKSNTTGLENTAVGYDASLFNTSGDDNTAVGRFALRSNETGRSNTALGNGALSSAKGNNNIGVGTDAGASLSPLTVISQSDRIVMGNDDHTDAYIKVSWTVTSDARDKTDFAPVPHGLSFISALEPTEYQFRAGGRDSAQGDGKRRYGFLAQDVLALEGQDPVITDNEDPEKLKLKESQLVPVLVNAVKELSAKVENLQLKLKNMGE